MGDCTFYADSLLTRNLAGATDTTPPMKPSKHYLMLRLDEPTHTALKKRAASDLVSMASFVRRMIAQELKKKEETK